MSVAQTSIDCYHDLEREGHISKQQKVILDVISPYRDYSLQELVRLTKLQINVISGRVFELKELGLLQHGATRKCSITGRTIHSLILPKTQHELNFSLQREL